MSSFIEYGPFRCWRCNHPYSQRNRAGLCAYCHIQRQREAEGLDPGNPEQLRAFVAKWRITSETRFRRRRIGREPNGYRVEAWELTVRPEEDGRVSLRSRQLTFRDSGHRPAPAWPTEIVADVLELLRLRRRGRPPGSRSGTFATREEFIAAVGPVVQKLRRQRGRDPSAAETLRALNRQWGATTDPATFCRWYRKLGWPGWRAVLADIPPQHPAAE